MTERPRFTSEIVNQLIKEKVIELKENKYVITQKGKEFRKYMLEKSGLDIDEELEWFNKKLQGYVLEQINGENLKQLIQDGFFSKSQVKDIKFCVENDQPLNIDLSREQADKLMELTKSL